MHTNFYACHLSKSFWKIAKLYWFSDDKWQARGLLALLVLFLCGFNALNVVISYAMRDLMTALAEKDIAEFSRSLWVCLGVFVVFTPTGALFGYVGNILGVNWRLWLTENFIKRYFQRRAYYHINSENIIDNPDQRITEDIKVFTTASLAFLTIILNSLIQLLAFIGVLWSISKTLVLVLVTYSIFGTVVTLLFGKRLIDLNFSQLRREADFRYGLVHVRDNTESIAFYRGEEQEKQQVRGRLREAIRNSLKLVGWERNLAFFTQGYQSLILLLPLAVLAPLYFSDEIKFGVLSQATGAFTQVLTALTIIVTQFERISQLAAGVSRLEAFNNALDNSGSTTKPENRGQASSTITLKEGSLLSLKSVTLNTPNREQTLIEKATLEVQSASGLLIVGPSGVGKSSLLRAIAGLWNAGQGTIVRPHLEEMIFLPQRPYMVLGSLREQLQYPQLDRKTSDAELLETLVTVNLADLPTRVGGFDAILDWGQWLSLGEQQRLAFARLLLTQPIFAVLDESTSALDVINEARLYEQLRQSKVSFVSVGHRPSLINYHDSVLVLQGKGEWRLMSSTEFLATQPT